ncbi:hypothetical protein ACPW96_20240 [Micromonospora sp. DT81.3]|uniref:hypothetical protein n=1 Tax=Micromonospora sp. DT81.3 TaxID=3416523 RepID=UPI003CF37B87
MATRCPQFPIPHNETAEISGPAYRIRRAADDLWIVDGLPGIQSEVRALGSGYFQVMHTNGTAHETMSFPSWREAMRNF